MPRKPRRSTRPKHSVDIEFKAWDIAKAGAALRFKVHDRDGLLVTIEVGQGTFGWKGARSKKPFRRISWSRFAAELDQYRHR
jgi:hypothetical protein